MTMQFLRMAALMALTTFMAAGSAFAHASLTASDPEDGATVDAGLAAIEMTFSDPVRLTLVRVHSATTDSDVPLQGALPDDFVGTAAVAVDPLAGGAYDVSWTCVAEDGHVMKGHFAFTVVKDSDPAPAQ
jgi:methionine-rich copper-binding protein CopC